MPETKMEQSIDCEWEEKDGRSTNVEWELEVARAELRQKDLSIGTLKQELAVAVQMKLKWVAKLDDHIQASADSQAALTQEIQSLKEQNFKLQMEIERLSG